MIAIIRAYGRNSTETGTDLFSKKDYFSRWFRVENKKAFPLEKGFLKRTDQIAGLSRFSSCPFSPGPVGRNDHQTSGKTGDRRSHDDGDHGRDRNLYDLWW